MRTRVFAVILAVALAACGGDGGNESSEEPSTAPKAEAPVKGGAAFGSPKDGAKVKSPVVVNMTAKNIQIEPSGKVRKGAGHFHVMVDAKCVPNGKVIPEDAKHVHFGDGSKKTELKLKPGKHTLCLQVGDGAHTAFGTSDTIKVTVK